MKLIQAIGFKTSQQIQLYHHFLDLGQPPITALFLACDIQSCRNIITFILIQMARLILHWALVEIKIVGVFLIKLQAFWGHLWIIFFFLGAVWLVLRIIFFLHQLGRGKEIIKRVLFLLASFIIWLWNIFIRFLFLKILHNLPKLFIWSHKLSLLATIWIKIDK